MTLSATGQPAGASAAFTPNPVTPTGSSSLTIGNLSGATPGVYTITVQGDGGTPPLSRTDTVDLTLYDAQPSAVTLLAPSDGQAGAPTAPTLSWSAAADATSYSVDVATDAAFSNIVTAASGLTATSYLPGGLAPNTVYYWRVTALNPCGSVQSETRAFLTATLSTSTVCSAPGLAIPDGNLTGTFDELTIPGGGAIGDLDVTVDITHTWVGDVAVRLQNTATATSVTLIDRPGVPASTFGCSSNNIDVTVNDEGPDTPIEQQCALTAPAISGDAPGSGLLSLLRRRDAGLHLAPDGERCRRADTGTLNEWCLVATLPSVTPTADYSDLEQQLRRRLARGRRCAAAGRCLDRQRRLQRRCRQWRRRRRRRQPVHLECRAGGEYRCDRDRHRRRRRTWRAGSTGTATVTSPMPVSRSSAGP